MDNRENVFTQFARDINLFCEHKLTKVDLYESFVYYLEIASEEEKNEKEKYENDLSKYDNHNIVELTKLDPPYSNYNEGLKMLE